MEKNFGDYKSSAVEWITVLKTEFFPDYLDEAKVLYGPVLEKFKDLVSSAKNSQDLLRSIAKEKQPIRTQLQRVFRKYVSPSTSVEMLKRIQATEAIIKDFGNEFRSILDVQTKLNSRPEPDDALMALLLEYKDRGQKGYEITEAFFTWFESKFSEYEITGPRRAGRDAMLNEVLPNFKKKTPADFLIKDKSGIPIVVGFARYDSDRGGAQEDDRTSGNRDKITEIFEYNKKNKNNIKILFLNDGPGLLLGSMWNDYIGLEMIGKNRVMVCTLKMLDDRLTKDWLLG